MTPESTTPRQRILDSALRLFYQQGYLATGINQIIADSKTAKATFYSHFPSKEKLCVAYLEARHEIWMGWLKESVAQQKTPGERLLGVFDFIREWMERCAFRGCAFLNIASEIPDIQTEIRSVVIHHKDELRGFLLQLLNEYRPSGKIPSQKDTSQLADMLYILLEGAIVACQNYGQSWPAGSAQQAAARLLAP